MARTKLKNGRLLKTYSDVVETFDSFLDIGGSMEIGIGWMNCVYDCCRKIAALNPKNFAITTISEKNGSLHIGYSFTYSEENSLAEIDFIKRVDDYIATAEEESKKTCEVCGNPGVMKDKEWKRVTCASCENYLYDIDEDDGEII